MLSFLDYLREAKKIKADPYGGRTLFNFPETPYEPEELPDFDPKHPDLQQQLINAHRLNQAIPEHAPPSVEEEAKKARKDWCFDKFDDLWIRQVLAQAADMPLRSVLGLRYWLALDTDKDGNFTFPDFIKEVKVPGRGRGKLTLKNIYIHRNHLLKKMHDLGYSISSARRKLSHLLYKHGQEVSPGGKHPNDIPGHKNMQKVFLDIFGTESLKGVKWNLQTHSVIGQCIKGSHRQERKAFDPAIWEKRSPEIEDQFWKYFKQFLDRVEKLEDNPNAYIEERWAWLRNYKFDDEGIKAIRDEAENKLKDIVGFEDPEFPEGLNDPKFVRKYIGGALENAVRKHARHQEAEPKTIGGVTGSEAGGEGSKDLPGDIAVQKQLVRDVKRKERERKEREEAEEREDAERRASDLSFKHWLSQQFREKPRPEAPRPMKPTVRQRPEHPLARKMLKKWHTAPPRAEPGYTMEHKYSFLNWLLKNEQGTIGGSTGGPYIHRKHKKPVSFQCWGDCPVPQAEVPGPIMRK